MAKKVDIGSKEFTKLLSHLPYSPHKSIIKKLDSKIFPLDNNKFFSYKPEQLAIQEYQRCIELFQKRNPKLKPEDAILRIGGIQKLIETIENPHREKLQKLAINTIREIYQVPDYIDMKAFINTKISLDTEQDHSPKPFLNLDSIEQKNRMRDEIQKRVILNTLPFGSSMVVYKGVHYMIAEEINKINPRLMELYDHYISNMGVHLWQMDIEAFQASIENGQTITQGYNKIRFDKNNIGGQIEARGLNLPVLLHELNKGVIDWLISAGIPKDFSIDELIYYYSKADRYEIEPWQYLLAPSIWLGLLQAANMDSEDLPKLIIKLTQLSYPELTDLFRLIQDNMTKAKEKIQSWNL